MSSKRTIYMHPGELLDIRILNHEDFERNAKDWNRQGFRGNILLCLVDSRSIAAANPMVSLVPWPQTSSKEQPK